MAGREDPQKLDVRLQHRVRLQMNLIPVILAFEECVQLLDGKCRVATTISQEIQLAVTNSHRLNEGWTAALTLMMNSPDAEVPKCFDCPAKSGRWRTPSKGMCNLVSG